MSATPGRRAASQAPEIITSRDNKWLKQFRAALGGDGADVLTGVEGARAVETALRSGAEVAAVLVSESGREASGAFAAVDSGRRAGAAH